MGKTFSTGLLTNGIWQDSSNNIGIGAAANASFKLQVTGATNLTGALSGTSATFSGNIIAGGSTDDTSGGLYSNIALNGTTYSRYSLLTGGTARARLQFDGTNTSLTTTSTGGKLQLATFGATAMEFVTNDTLRLTIASTGAATFTGTTGNRLTLYNSGNNGGQNGLLIDSDIYPAISFNNRVGTIGTAKIVYNTYATGYGSASLAGSFLLQGDNAMQFSTGGDNVRMTITSGGNVGIGTPFVITPYLTSGQSGVLQVATNVAKDATGGPHPVAFFSSNDATYPLGLLVQTITGATTGARKLKIQGTEIGVSANDIVMQVDGGNVSIGTTDSGRKLSVKATYTPGFFHNNNNASGQYCNIWQLGGSETNNTSSYYLLCDTDFVGVRMVIYGNGNIANVNNVYGAYSDIKLKENIVDATPKLNDLLKVKVRSYNLKGDNTKQIGVVAQELEEIFPGLIEESNDTIKDENGQHIETGEKTKSVKYSVFVPMLIKAIQELKAEIDELKNR